MTTAERREYIVKLVKQEEYCTYKQLGELLGVSEMTVRRDINALVVENRLLKGRGGAGFERETRAFGKMASFSARCSNRESEKREIAKRAVANLKTGNTLFIDASTTALYMAYYLPTDLSLTVVTNGAEIVPILAGRHISVYCTGGYLNPYEKGYFGKPAEDFISLFHFDAAYVTSWGIIPDVGIYDYTESAKSLQMAVRRQAQRFCYLCLECKIGKRLKHHTLALSEVDEVICASDKTEKLFKDAHRYGEGKKGHDSIGTQE